MIYNKLFPNKHKKVKQSRLCEINQYNIKKNNLKILMRILSILMSDKQMMMKIAN